MDMYNLYDLYLQNPSVQTDTRKIKNGDIFFALKGPNFNGNSFARQAIDAGAVMAVIDDAQYAIPGKTMLVEDGLASLQALALQHRKSFSIPFIGITGSNGKTTTKELIHAVLSTRYKTYTTEGNLNNHIGVPLTILKIKHDAEIAIIEMGANHIGEIASYCRMALPTHGLITNCGKAHLEGFGSEEGVKKGKGELYDHLRTLTHGYAFVMWDYPYLQEMSKGISGIIKYGTADAHVIGTALQSEPFLAVKMEQGLSAQVINTQLVGDYNLPNVLAAITIGDFFNIPEENIITAISGYAPGNSRSQLVEKDSHKVILDAYNANPSSMKLAIQNFARQQVQPKILLLGSMAELGSASLAEHQAIVEEIKKTNWLHVVLVGDEFKKTGHPFIQLSNAAEAKEWLQQQSLQNTYMLIKGSRSQQMEKIIS